MGVPSISQSEHSAVSYAPDWKLTRQFVQICLVCVIFSCMVMGIATYALFRLDANIKANHSFGVGNRIVSCHILEKSGDPSTPECVEVLGK